MSEAYRIMPELQATQVFALLGPKLGQSLLDLK
jgi:hypothetical protein